MKSIYNHSIGIITESLYNTLNGDIFILREYFMNWKKEIQSF